MPPWCKRTTLYFMYISYLYVLFNTWTLPHCWTYSFMWILYMLWRHVAVCKNPVRKNLFFISLYVRHLSIELISHLVCRWSLFGGAGFSWRLYESSFWQSLFLIWLFDEWRALFLKLVLLLKELGQTVSTSHCAVWMNLIWQNDIKSFVRQSLLLIVIEWWKGR